MAAVEAMPDKAAETAVIWAVAAPTEVVAACPVIALLSDGAIEPMAAVAACPVIALLITGATDPTAAAEVCPTMARLSP